MDPQGLAPVQGDVTPWLDLVEHVIADEAQREYTLDWQAYTLQYQNVKINHALVVGGEPRTGKDTMFEPLKRGIGDRYHADVNGTELASEYEDYAVGKKLVTMSEVRFKERRARIDSKLGQRRRLSQSGYVGWANLTSNSPICWR